MLKNLRHNVRVMTVNIGDAFHFGLRSFVTESFDLKKIVGRKKLTNKSKREEKDI